MQKHLAEDCANCQKIHELWTNVAAGARREPLYEPPSHALRSARGQFALGRALPWKKGSFGTFRMVFDSLLSPLPSGIRSSGVLARQLVYQVNDYFLDLKLEREPSSDKMSLVGQIRNSQDPDKKMADIPVILLLGQSHLGQATTNVFGEFRLKLDPKEGLWLALGIQGEAGIVVPLDRVVGRELVGTGQLRNGL